MNGILDYVVNHTERTACRCGKCIDGKVPVDAPWDVVHLTEYHHVNMFFFDVSVKGNPTAEEFIRLTHEWKGTFNEVDPFDGQEHGYMELGGWIGDQGLAMQYMALGKILGLWSIMHPGDILNVNIPEEKALADQLAGAGMVTILGKK